MEVIKRGGRKESFSIDKLILSISKAFCDKLDEETKDKIKAFFSSIDQKQITSEDLAIKVEDFLFDNNFINSGRNYIKFRSQKEISRLKKKISFLKGKSQSFKQQLNLLNSII